MSDPKPASHGVVLAGGAGSRIGSAKPLVELGGRALISFPIAAMQAAGLSVTILAKRHTPLPPAQPGIEVLYEPDEPVHPLLGIVTALEKVGQPIVICACDMPFVSAELLAWVATVSEQAAAVPLVGDHLQPMIGRYAPEALAALRETLDTAGSAHRAIELAGLRRITRDELAVFGDPERLLFDVDTPDDLDRARGMIAPAG